MVTVEFINCVNLTDSIAFYATEASYAAALAMSFERSQKIFVVSTHNPTKGSPVECAVTRVVYAGV